MEKKINQLFKGDVIFEEGNYYLFLKGTHQKTARSKEVITLFLEDFITRKKFEKKFYHSETKFEVRTILQKKFNFLYLKGEAVSFLNIEEDSNFETEEIFLPQDSKLKNYSWNKEETYWIYFDDEKALLLRINERLYPLV